MNRPPLVVGEPRTKPCDGLTEEGPLKEDHSNCVLCDGTKQVYRPFWECENCGHKNYNKQMPEDRAKFYDKVATKGSPICPYCRSESFMPVGY